MSEIAELPKVKKIKGGNVVSKITINSKRFLNACNKAVKAIDSKSIVPAISNILIEVVGDSLKLTGTNLRHTIVTKAYYGVIGSTARFMFPAASGIKLLQALPDIPVDISHVTSIQKSGEVDTILHQVEISCNGKSYSIDSDDPKDFVKAINLADQEPFIISSDQIAKGILFCAPFTTENVNYPSWGGINFDIKGSKLTMVATDGQSLAKYETDLTNTLANDITFLLPAKAASLLSELNKGNIEVRLSNNGIEFSDGATSIFSLLIDDRFPDVENAFQKNFNTEITVDANELKSALNRISIISNDARTHMTLSGEILEIDSIGINSSSDGKEEVVISEFFGEDLRIGVNPVFVIRSLSKITAGTIKIQGTGPSRPMIILSSAEPEMTFLVMPAMWNNPA